MYGRPGLPATDIREKDWLQNRYLISDCYRVHEGNIALPDVPDRAAVNLAAFTSAFGSLAAAIRSVTIRMVGLVVPCAVRDRESLASE
jgi:hypothetical protein